MIDNFFTSLFGSIIEIFFWLLGIIVSLFVYPIQLIIVTAFPDVGNYLTTVVDYFTDDVFPMISFVKEVVLGITCIPHALWDLIIGILLFKVGVVPLIVTIKTAMNAWRIKNANYDVK